MKNLFQIRIYELVIVLLLILGCERSRLLQNSINTYYCNGIERNDALSLSQELKPYEHLLETKTGIVVLEDGNNALITRAWLAEYAEKTIDIQYFIFSTDNTGLIAIDYLVRAADRGVKVRLLVDDVIIKAKVEEIVKLDAHENIEIKIYNPVLNVGKNIFQKLGNLAFDFRNSNQRMHNKTFTVDGKVSITGGRNIADEYFDSSKKYNFRDRDVLLVGKTVEDVSVSFEDFWNSKISVPIKKLTDFKRKNKTPNFDRLHEYACNPKNFWPQIREKIDNFHHVIRDVHRRNKIVWVEDVKFMSDIPGKNDGSEGLQGGGKLTEELFDLINSAEESIDIQTPYLITTELGNSLFRKAVKRGVKVRILTNSMGTTDNLAAFGAYQNSRSGLLKSGVRLFEYKPNAKFKETIITGELIKTLDYDPVFGLHAKSMVIDGKISVVGTFNMDPRSVHLNTECVAIINSEQIASEILGYMSEEFKKENSWETTKKFNPDSKFGTWKNVLSWTSKLVPEDIL